MELEGDERSKEVSFKMKENSMCSHNDGYGARKNPSGQSGRGKLHI